MFCPFFLFLYRMVKKGKAVDAKLKGKTSNDEEVPQRKSARKPKPVLKEGFESSIPPAKRIKINLNNSKTKKT